MNQYEFHQQVLSDNKKIKPSLHFSGIFLMLILGYFAHANISEPINAEASSFQVQNNYRKNKNIKIIAHRGASAYAPENTLAAFAKAVELGANMIELDVRQTKDGHLIVIHDATADRTMNGKGLIEDLTIDEIRALDAGIWFSDKFKNEKIPLLEEVFVFIPDSIELLIEIKESSEDSPNIEKNVVELIRKYKAENRVILKSFKDEILGHLRKIAPEISLLKVFVCDIDFLGLVIEKGLRLGSALNDQVQYLQPHWLCTSKSYIKKAHKREFKIFAWDVNSESRMSKLIELGIDGIETDYPELLKKLLIDYHHN